MSWSEIDARKKKERTTAGDAATEERHRMFDLQAQDKTPKSDRPHFAVVGEGTRTANENFRDNFPDIDWSK